MDEGVQQCTLVVVGRCQQTRKLFGVTFKLQGFSHWVSEWAFPIEENVDRKRERYVEGSVQGSFELVSGYPGCPHCKNPSIFQCANGHIACWDGHTLFVACPWCGSSGKLTEKIESMSKSSDA